MPENGRSLEKNFATSDARFIAKRTPFTDPDFLYQSMILLWYIKSPAYKLLSAAICAVSPTPAAARNKTGPAHPETNAETMS